MRIAIIAVGKIKQAGMRASIDDYLARIQRYTRCEEIELKDGSDAEVQTRFDKAIPERARVVALEVDGRAMSSKGLADWMARAELESVNSLAFLIGGAYGLPKPVSNAAALRLSLSSLTLPHRLARLVLVEQIYRSYTILRNEPYDH